MIFPRKEFEKASCKDANIEKGLLVDLFDKVEEEKWNLHSLFLAKNGAKVFETYAQGHGPDFPEEVYSVSKTFVAAAIGICQDLHLLNVHDPLLSYFKSDLHGKYLPGYENVRIEDLLTMSVGHETEAINGVLAGADPYETFFNIPLEYEPGTHFFYNNLATFMLSRLVQRVSGMKTNDFLNQHLYSRIDMPKPKWREAFGNSIGPYGLQLSAPDLARFGMLLLNEGIWRGEQVISREFVLELGKYHVSTPKSEHPVDRFGYGYQVWINDFGDFRLAGMYKQYVIVHKETGVVFVTQAFETREVLDLFTSYILPAVQKGWMGDNFTLRTYLQRFADHSGPQLTAEKKIRAEQADGVIEFPFES